MSTHAANRRGTARKTRARRVLASTCVLTFVFSVCAAFLDSAVWNARIGREAVERASVRLLADGSVYAAPSCASERDLLEERLNASAREYLDARENDADALRAVSVGLARWNDPAAFATTRDSDRRASQHAVEALTALEPNDDNIDDVDLDAALAFLQELDGAADGSTDDAVVYAFEFERNPTDALGVVARSELAPTPFVQAARRASLASSRALALATLFAFLGACVVAPCGGNWRDVLRLFARVFLGVRRDFTRVWRERGGVASLGFAVVLLSTVRLRN